MRESKASKEQIEKRREMMSEFEKWKARVKEEWDKEKDLRIELRGVDTDTLESNKEEYNEETIEFLVKVEEKIVGE